MVCNLESTPLLFRRTDRQCVLSSQEFAIQTSLAIARDRVLGILLGLIAMWLVFDGLGTARATDQMADAFIKTLGR